MRCSGVWSGRLAERGLPALGGGFGEDLPTAAAQTTCPCFVGKGLDRLLVASAFQGYSPSARRAGPGAGYPFVIDGGFRGQGDVVFRLVAEAV
jgi:sugar lactone lactonase YvrE